MRALVAVYSHEAWNLDKFLSTWFHSVVEFRCALARTGAVVSGSQVLRFLGREEPLLTSDLDIVTRLGGALPLASYLLLNGYTRVFMCPAHRAEPYPVALDAIRITGSKAFKAKGGKHGILHIMDFVKRSPNVSQATNKHVQVSVVTQDPVEHICFSYHSSKCPTSDSTWTMTY